MSTLLEELASCEAIEAERAAARYRGLVGDTANGKETDVADAKNIMAAAGITLEQFRRDVSNRETRKRRFEQFAMLPDAERAQREHTEAIAAEIAKFEELHRQHVAEVYRLRLAFDAATEVVRASHEAERKLIAGATDLRLLAQRDELIAEADRLSRKCTEAINARQTAQRALGNSQIAYQQSPTAQNAERVQRLSQTVRDQESLRQALSAPATVPGSVLFARAAIERFEKEFMTGVDA